MTQPPQPAVQPVPGVAGGVHQLLYGGALVTVKPEQLVLEISGKSWLPNDYLLLQVSRSRGRAVWCMRTCSSPSKLKIVKSIPNRGERVGDVPEVAGQGSGPVQFRAGVHWACGGGSLK